MEFGILPVIFGLINLVAFIWLVVVAFRESLIWGFLVLLFSPISAIAFAIYHWRESKKPFLVYLVSGVILIVVVWRAMDKMGVIDTIETTHKTMKQLEKGEISEDEASKRMADQVQSNIDRMAKAGVIGTDEQKALKQKVQKLKSDDANASTTSTSAVAKKEHEVASSTDSSRPQTAKKSSGTSKTAEASNTAPVTETSPQPQKPAKQKPEFGPDWSLQKAIEEKQAKFKKQLLDRDLPVPKPEGKYVAIPISQAEKYIGREVRVVRLKTTNDGLLKRVNENYLILDMQVSGGQADYEIKRTDVHSMYVLDVTN